MRSPRLLPAKAAAVADMFLGLLLTRSSHQRSNCFALRDFLFHHLVGAEQNRLRHIQTERLGGLEVQDHLKFCRELNG
jgi:hypothetical protein